MFKSGINLIKDIDSSKKTVVFAFSKLNDYDSDDDYTEKTAFDKTMRESGPDGSNRIRHVWNHDRKDFPIGKPMRMWRDAEYAYTESKLLDNQKAMDAWDAYSQGAINEHSYWGKALNTGVNPKGGKIIKEVKLLEVSTVLWGAQEKAKLIELIKGGDQPEPWFIEHIKGLQDYVKKSNASDDFLETLEIELEKAIDIIDSLEKAGREKAPVIIEPKYDLSLAEIYKLKMNF